MKTHEAKRLLADLTEIAVGRPRDNRRQIMRTLNKIRSRISIDLCLCGQDWSRGGFRQGSALCEKCYLSDL